MSEYDFDNDEFDASGNAKDILAQLRKALKEKDKALKELTDNYAAVSKRDRERALADALKEKNVSPKVAKFFPSDKDVTEENINAFLMDNADVFGFKLEDGKPADEQPPAPPVPDAYKRLQAISDPASSIAGDAAVVHQLTSAASEADLIAMILAAGGGGA